MPGRTLAYKCSVCVPGQEPQIWPADILGSPPCDFCGKPCVLIEEEPHNEVVTRVDPPED